MLLGTAAAGCGGDPPEAPNDSLVVLLPSAPRALDPRFVWDVWGLRVSRLIFGSLMTVDPETLEPVPQLAESFEMRDARTAIVRLRAGLVYSDGARLDAAAARESLLGVKDEALGSRYARMLAPIASIDASDDRTLVIHLGEPHATLATDLEIPLVRPEDARRAMAETPEAMVGAGPYRLVSRTPTRVVLEANPRWVGPPPVHPRVSLEVVREPNVRVMRLRAGSADWIADGLPLMLAPALDGAGHLHRTPGVSTRYVGFQTESGPFADVRVREAMAHAVDRGVLARHVRRGFATPATSLIPAGHWAEASPEARAYDTERARAILAAAGHRPDEDGVALRATLVVASGHEGVALARAIAAMAREAGIALDVQPLERATLMARLSRGQFDAVLMQMPEVVEPHVLSYFFHSSRIPVDGAGGGNRFRLRDAEVDAALDAGGAEANRTRRRPFYVELQARMHQLLPVLPLVHDEIVVVTRDASAPAMDRLGRLSGLYRAGPR